MLSKNPSQRPELDEVRKLLGRYKLDPSAPVPDGTDPARLAESYPELTPVTAQAVPTLLREPNSLGLSPLRFLAGMKETPLSLTPPALTALPLAGLPPTASIPAVAVASPAVASPAPALRPATMPSQNSMAAGELESLFESPPRGSRLIWVGAIAFGLVIGT